MKAPQHVCQHTDEGEAACDRCTYNIIGAPKHSGTKTKTASFRRQILGVSNIDGHTLNVGPHATPKTPPDLKVAMRANRAEVHRILRGREAHLLYI